MGITSNASKEKSEKVAQAHTMQRTGTPPTTRIPPDARRLYLLQYNSPHKKN